MSTGEVRDHRGAGTGEVGIGAFLSGGERCHARGFRTKNTWYYGKDAIGLFSMNGKSVVRRICDDVMLKGRRGTMHAFAIPLF